MHECTTRKAKPCARRRDKRAPLEAQLRALQLQLQRLAVQNDQLQYRQQVTRRLLGSQREADMNQRCMRSGSLCLILECSSSSPCPVTACAWKPRHIHDYMLIHAT
jgi:hypothetical protein